MFSTIDSPATRVLAISVTNAAGDRCILRPDPQLNIPTGDVTRALTFPTRSNLYVIARRVLRIRLKETQAAQTRLRADIPGGPFCDVSSGDRPEEKGISVAAVSVAVMRMNYIPNPLRTVLTPVGETLVVNMH